jgi:hypothetical protein
MFGFNSQQSLCNAPAIMNHSNLPNVPASMNHGNLPPHVNVHPTPQSIYQEAFKAARRRYARQIHMENEAAKFLRQSQQPSGVSKVSTSGRVLRNTRARIKRGGPAKVAVAAEQFRAPDNFPLEIVLNILRHICVREGEKT